MNSIIFIQLNIFMLCFRSLLSDTQRLIYDLYKRFYAEMLFRWNLLVARAKILKYLSVNTDNFRDVEYVTECMNCSRVTRAPLCKECRIPLLNCVLCRLPVKGLANACLNCGHGGHTVHMKNWFSVRNNISLNNKIHNNYRSSLFCFDFSFSRKMNSVHLDAVVHV